MPTATLKEAMEIERGDEEPANLNVAGQIRRRLLRGEALVSTDIGDTPSKRSMFHQTLKTMQQLGYKVSANPEPNANGRGTVKRYSITNPEHVPSEAQFKKLTTGRKTRAVAARAATKGNNGAAEPKPLPLSVSVFPALGASVRVAGLHEVNGGGVEVILKDGGKTWTARIQSN